MCGIMVPMSSIASWDNVSYLYPRSVAPVIRDLSLDLREGEFLGLIGPTGAGKSTLCLTLNGIVPQFYGGRFFGRLTVAGLDSLDHPISALARHVGMILEDPEIQITAFSVENEVAFALENLSVPRDEIRARIPEALAAVRLEGMEKKHPYQLSGGQKQRLVIAAALALRPRLLVLDEPTAQLDPVGAREVFEVVRELNRELGLTIVLAGHAAEELAEYADRIALLAEGRLIRVGAPDEVYGDVALLMQHDLRPPEVTRTFYLLRERGVPVGTLPVRLDAGISKLREIWAEDERGPQPCSPIAANAPTRPPDATVVLSADNLWYEYEDGTRALRGVSCEVRQGEYVLIAGQNGAGKTTLVRHFLKLLEPTLGQVHVWGEPTAKLTVSDLARRIGYVGQNPDSQIFNATVEDEVAFALRNLNYATVEVARRVSESLNDLGLQGMRHRHPLSLPRGDRARVVIAAVLAMRPEILIFDEPTTGQDDRGVRAILEITRRLHHAGKTIIVITHQLHLMPDYAERVLVMGEGTLLLDAPTREAFHATGVLEATYLMPPQAVRLAQAICPHDSRGCPMLTPEDVASCTFERIKWGAVGEDAYE
jgi:energy-coupling factor transport system ATP-binding protein